jgi:hydrogenase maturation protein HypF
VTNTGDGVVIVAIAQHERLSAFLAAISADAPPLSRIVEVRSRPLAEPSFCNSFTILPSSTDAAANTAIPPDIGICHDCLRELFDAGDRRFHYPFTNCTNCGPRFTIVHTIPYDRPKTSMNVFPMCRLCHEEYHDPINRRFHAQPNACPQCGPALSLHDRHGNRLATSEPLAEVAHALRDGKIVAIRGLGGFHLAVDGCSPDAVALLRARKNRPDKPLAIMIRDLQSLERFCRFNATEQQLLLSLEQPIVLLQRRADSELAENLAPGIAEIGVMLPYTPLHHLLLTEPQCPEALVMTSGNASSAPICTSNEDGLNRLAGIADLFLLHNREIVTRVDDSVARIVGKKQQLLRRARGYVPTPLDVPWNLPPTLGCGAGLKNTFSLGRAQSVVVSQHIGDLDTLDVLEFYEESIDHLKKLLQLEPEVVACDLHPDYMSSRFAEQLGLPLYQVQHHHAHAVAVMAEHSLDEQVLALVMDGTGLGPDNTVWGGELLLATTTDFIRLGHLGHLHLPGGDAAATQPWRMGLASLYAAYGPEGITRRELAPALITIPGKNRETILAMLENGFNVPLTSSCGRLFDAVASLLGIRQEISFEGQAAMELEALARKAATAGWYNNILSVNAPPDSSLLAEKGGKVEISTLEFVKLLVEGKNSGRCVPELALWFHMMLIASITGLCERFAHQTGVRRIVVTGGCMQNSLLLEGFFHTLPSIGLQVFTGNRLPVNDGAISFGQTIIGGLRHVSRHSHAGRQD